MNFKFDNADDIALSTHFAIVVANNDSIAFITVSSIFSSIFGCM